MIHQIENSSKKTSVFMSQDYDELKNKTYNGTLSFSGRFTKTTVGCKLEPSKSGVKPTSIIKTCIILSMTSFIDIGLSSSWQINFSK